MPLFDTPPAVAAETRRESRQEIAPHTDDMRGEVLAALVTRGRRGATDEELARELSMRGDTERARRVELRDAGLVIDSGRRRPTSSGRRAVVWIAATADQPAARSPDPPRRSPAPAVPPTPTPPDPAASADQRPARPCYTCGSRAFWSHRVSPSHFVCEVCHPPVAADYVAHRVIVPDPPPCPKSPR
ncbi:MAG: hypothetical protein RBS80_22985 [Thermoguttaceae bacterium]|nr:hypothetical protein [Thermoguttaceae bacterium]